MSMFKILYQNKELLSSAPLSLKHTHLVSGCLFSDLSFFLTGKLSPPASHSGRLDEQPWAPFAVSASLSSSELLL